MTQKDRLPMTPTHPRWREFIYRLDSEEGCNFRVNSKDNWLKEKNTAGKLVAWIKPDGLLYDCNNKLERPFAVAILQKMGNIDIPKSLEFFNEHGGYCDCEILFNVEATYEVRNMISQKK